MRRVPEPQRSGKKLTPGEEKFPKQLAKLESSKQRAVGQQSSYLSKLLSLALASRTHASDTHQDCPLVPSTLSRWDGNCEEAEKEHQHRATHSTL